MLLTKEILISITNRNVTYFKLKGYDIESIKTVNHKGNLVILSGATLLVAVDDLASNSREFVEVKCDYCQVEIIKKRYIDYLSNHKNIEKDCCKKCTSLKTKESNMKVHGVESTNSLQHVLEKRFNTNIDRYGFTNPNMNEEVKKKKEQVFLDKYGETSPAKNLEVKAKTIGTNNERYGGNSPSCDKEVRLKQIATLNDNYNVDYPMQSRKLQIKARESLYENNTAPTSRQQMHIHDIIGGELNFPHYTSSLDIAFPNEKVYVEIDLGGHNLQVKLGNLTEEEFNEAEKRRWYALYRKGWKEIRIISKTDKIPSDEKILEIIQFAKDYLNNGHHYMKFNLDENTVKCSQFEESYDFGLLRWIYKHNQHKNIIKQL